MQRPSSATRAEISSYVVRHRKGAAAAAEAIAVDGLDPVVRDFLAMQRLGQLFEGSGKGNRDWRPHEVQARAALVPINNPKCRDPWLIKRRSVDVGRGSAVQVDLTQTGYHCNYVSAKHATIFYDQFARVYGGHKTDVSKAKAAKFANCTKMSADHDPKET